MAPHRYSNPARCHRLAATTGPLLYRRVQPDGLRRATEKRTRTYDRLPRLGRCAGGSDETTGASVRVGGVSSGPGREPRWCALRPGFRPYEPGVGPLAVSRHGRLL